MLDIDGLFNLAKSRFEEAKVLQKNTMFDGALYLLGYAVELMLKRHIVKTLNWSTYPSSKKEFEGYASFKNHDLDILLKLSGLEKEISENSVLEAKWNIVKKWKTDWRYRDLGTLVQEGVDEVINVTRDMLNWINQK